MPLPPLQNMVPIWSPGLVLFVLGLVLFDCRCLHCLSNYRVFCIETADILCSRCPSCSLGSSCIAFEHLRVVARRIRATISQIHDPSSTAYHIDGFGGAGASHHWGMLSRTYNHPDSRCVLGTSVCIYIYTLLYMMRDHRCDSITWP